MTRRAAVLFLAALLPSCAAQEFLDRVDQALTFSFANDQIRTRFSGLLDLEGYEFSQPAPGLINSGEHTLFNPRLSLFVDSQLGSKLYFFAQARLDRGFDPSDEPAEVRLDEYALRYTPWEDGRFNVQLGKFASIIGTWIPRHLSWDNPFINAPVPYENVTFVSDTELPASFEEFFHPDPAEKYDRNPIIWGPAYTTGASLAGRLKQFELAAEIKNAPLSSRPESWKPTEVGFDHPSIAARIGYRPNEMWNFGLSGSEGAYLRPELASALPPDRGLGDYRQSVLGQDISFAWHHWQFWAEFFEARWEVPTIGKVDTFSYYLETKYKITAQLFGALRWNQQLFGTTESPDGDELRVGHDLWRTDLALGYRFTAHTQLKLQYSLQHESSVDHSMGHMLATQFTIRF